MVEVPGGSHAVLVPRAASRRIALRIRRWAGDILVMEKRLVAEETRVGEDLQARRNGCDQRARRERESERASERARESTWSCVGTSEALVFDWTTTCDDFRSSGSNLSVNVDVESLQPESVGPV